MSDHIPDPTKMISDTPRTDAAWKPDGGDGYPTVDVDVARTLERELNAANDRIKRLQAVTNDPHALWSNWLRGSVALPVGIGDVREYQERIKRLEEAGDAMEKYIFDQTNTRFIICAIQWREAKEAKP